MPGPMNGLEGINIMSRIDEIANNRSDDELYNIGLEYRDGLNGYNEDGGCEVVQMPETAIKYFTKAAERGHILSKYELAVMYEKGIGCAANIEKAIEWYSAVASHGFCEAREALERLRSSNGNQKI